MNEVNNVMKNSRKLKIGKKEKRTKGQVKDKRRKKKKKMILIKKFIKLVKINLTNMSLLITKI